MAFTAVVLLDNLTTIIWLMIDPVEGCWWMWRQEAQQMDGCDERFFVHVGIKISFCIEPNRELRVCAPFLFHKNTVSLRGVCLSNNASRKKRLQYHIAQLNQRRGSIVAVQGKECDEHCIKHIRSSMLHVTMDTENKQDIFSPFSSKARRLASNPDDVFDTPDDVTFGFKHCRSVSVLLKIGVHLPCETHSSQEDYPDQDGYGPILFPLKDGNEQDLVLVNPHAFEHDDSKTSSGNTGDRKRIAGKATVETARLVAEVVSCGSKSNHL